MRLRTLTVIIFIFYSVAHAQVIDFPYSENFDGVIAPSLPTGWTSSSFSIITSSALSSPNCISTTGNTSVKQLTSPLIDFSNKSPEKLVFYERRSNTAAGYRLEIRASTDGTNFNILLARFDTISTTTNYVQRIISLDGTGLRQQSNVRIRWQLLGDNTNTTGVLRIDDITLAVATGFDVGLSQFNISPVQATRKDSIMLSVAVKNYGSFPSSYFSIRFFGDENTNGLCEPSEQFSVLSGFSLNIGDSLICTISHAPLKTGEHSFIAVIDYSSDEYSANDTTCITVHIGVAKGDMLVNEIMYYPIGDEPEWVELLNTSSDTINLKGWRISDSNISTRSLVTPIDVLVAPYSYILIAKDIAFTSYHSGIPFVATNFSALNNSTPDAVVIYDSWMNTIDSVLYAHFWGGQNGKSLERIDAEIQSNVSTNWGTSQDSLGCTPGRNNSIARYNFDLRISNLTQVSALVDGKAIPVVHVSVQNIGRQFADSIIVSFYNDRNRNSVPELSECISTLLAAQSLVPGDSILLIESFPQLASGVTNIIAHTDWWRDDNMRNNQASVSVTIHYEPRTLVINEIMYNPFSGQNEWLEIFNRSDQSIDLAHWTLNDRPTLNSVNSFEITDLPFAIKSGEYAILAADSSLFKVFQNLSVSDSTLHIRILNHSGGFSLNNDGDVVVLKDHTSLTIDSVAYLPSWHHPDAVDTKGRSLERISPNIDSNDPRNWSTCTNLLGGTPGKINSIITTSSKSSSLISISQNPFSPDGDGFEDFCVIRYNLPMMTSIVNLRIYDIKGRLVRTLANGELIGRQGELVWNGFDDNKQRVRIGVYVIFLEATDQSTNSVIAGKGVVVVAAKL
jgi:hypothetical protein